MEIIDPQQKREFEERKSHDYSTIHPENKGRMLAGLFVVIIGCLILAEKMGAWFPDWLFSWQTLLIAIGIFVGAKHNFRFGGWLIPIFIGSIFLLDEFIPDFNLRPYFLPVVLIAVGVVMILSRGRRGMRPYRRNFRTPDLSSSSKEDVMESVSIFGGVKRNVITKNFKGGEVVTVFGGSEINLMQADIQGTVKMDLVQVFGGTKLIIPSNWHVQSELVSIFGDIQDTRLSSKDQVDSGKILLIEGVSFMGGISIKSY